MSNYLKCLILGAMLFIGACAPAPATTAAPSDSPATATPEPTPTPDGDAADTLRLLYWQAPVTLNPHLSAASKDWEASRLTYEPLASFDKAGELIPFLAAEIPTLDNGGLSPDGKSATWRLKEGVRWSDGEAFTAADVKFTYDYIVDPETASSSAGVYAGVESVEVLDDLTVKVNFKEITPAWAQPFVGSQGAILPQHIFEPYQGANAQDAPANLEPVGTGPYRAIDFSAEDVLIIGNDVVETIKIVYEANPFFREPDKPYFKRVELRGGGDAEVAARAVLEEGQVDYAWNVQVDAEVLEELKALGKGAVFDAPRPTAERFFLNHSDPNRATVDGEFSSLEFPHPFFSDLRVRQAFAYAIDRETIANEYGIAGVPVNSIMVARPAYETPNPALPTDYDLDKAKSLLDEAGWLDSNDDGIRDKDGRKMKVLIQSTVNPLRERVIDIFKNSLEEIGVDVETKIIDSSVFGKREPTNINSVFHFYADIQLLAWGDFNPDPGNYLNLWTCQQIPQMDNGWSGFNFERWCSAEYDQLYYETTVTVDPEARRQTIIQMTNILDGQVVTIPLIQRSFPQAVGNTLAGVDPTPWDSDVWNIKDWRRKSP